MSVIDTTIEAKTLQDLVKEKPAVEASEPKMTAKLVDEAVELLKEVEQNNGYGGIAQKLGLTQSQVKRVHAKMQAKIVELTPKEELVDIEPIK